ALALVRDVDRGEPIRLHLLDVERALRQLWNLLNELRTEKRRHPVDLVAADGANKPRVRHRSDRRLLRVELRDPDGLRTQLDDRTRTRIALEETDRDERRDQAREQDAEQEERRKAEPERPEHGPSLTLYALAGSRAGLTL